MAMELSSLAAAEPLIFGLGGNGVGGIDGAGAAPPPSLPPGLLSSILDQEYYYHDPYHHHPDLALSAADDKTVLPGADSAMIFDSLVGPDTFPNFLAASFTINAHRLVAHLTAIGLFNWVLPSTTGEFRTAMEKISIFSNPTRAGINIYVNLANMIYQIIGRFLVDVLIYGTDRTVEGVTSKSLKEIVDLVFTDSTATNNMHRFIIEAFGMVFGWGAVRAVTALESGGITNPTIVTRAKRSRSDEDKSGDLAENLDAALDKIVRDLEDEGAAKVACDK